MSETFITILGVILIGCWVVVPGLKILLWVINRTFCGTGPDMRELKRLQEKQKQQDSGYCPDMVCTAARRNPFTGYLPDANTQPEQVETIQQEQPAPEYTPIRGDDVERIKVDGWPIRIDNDN